MLSHAYLNFFLCIIFFLFQDELLAELEEMEEEELNRQLLDVGGSVADDLPSVPVAEPSRPEPKVGEWLAALPWFTFSPTVCDGCSWRCSVDLLQQSICLRRE